MVKLKSCPFCGSDAELLVVPDRQIKWIVRCRKCFTNNGTFSSDHDAIEAWNRRAEIVKCKDCKHGGETPTANGMYWCKLHGTFMYYCSDAERS